MERKVEFRRQSADIIRSVVAPLLTTRANLRGDTGTALLNALSRVTLESTCIPEMLEERTILSSAQLNALLDAIFLDHSVLYTDAFTLQDELEKLQRLFDDHVGTLMMSIETLATEVESIIRKRELGISFSRSFHRTPIAEGTTNGFYGVSINSSARTYRLACVSMNHASASSASVSAVLLSGESRIVMEGDPKKAFSTNMLDPYYILVNSENEPLNLSYYTDDFSDELGVVVSIVVRFSNVVPVSRVRLQPFSNSRVEVLGVYSPLNPNSTWETDVMQKLHGRMMQTSREIEIMFPRTYVSELHIVLRQSKFISVPENIGVSGLHLNDYLSYASQAMIRCISGGFSAADDVARVEEFGNALRESLSVPRVPVRAGSRLYVIGVASLIVEDTSYQLFGMHESVSELIDESPLQAAMLFDNNSSLYDKDFAVLGYIKYNGTVYPVLPLGSGRNVRDAITVPYSCIDFYDNYNFHLNFLVDASYPLTVRCNGKEKTFDTPFVKSYTYTKDGRTLLVIPRTRLEELGIVYGMPLIFEYTVPELTKRGERYSPEILKMTDVVGSVTLDHSCVREIKNHYIYVKLPDQTTSFVELEEGTYERYTYEGEEVFVVTTTKGLSGDPFVVNGDTTYVPATSVVGPFNGCYQAIIEEPISLTYYEKFDNTYVYTATTEYPYVRGTLSVYCDGEQALVEEYDEDYEGNIHTNAQRRQLKVHIDVKGGVATAKATYIPLVPATTVRSCILPHNAHEVFSLDGENTITLSNPAFADPDIIKESIGGEFGLTDSGVFYLKRNFSVTYEPVIVVANGIRCRNVTDYRGTGKSVEKLPSVPSFTVDPTNSRRLIFDRELRGTVTVDYYTIPTSLSGGFMFFHSNPQRDSESPMLRWYDILVDTK